MNAHKDNMKTPTRFRLPNGLEQAKIDALLAKLYAFLAETPLAQTWHTYDTFDRRLLAQSLTLQWSGAELLLRAVAHGDASHDAGRRCRGTMPCDRLPLSSPPRMAMDLPEGEFRARLAAVIKMRALLELPTVHTWSCTYRILNEDEKTVVRLIYTEVRLDGDDEEPPRATYLTVAPLRGYAKQAGQLAGYLRRHFDIAPKEEDIYFWAQQSAGQLPGAYSAKLDVQLQRGMPAGEATKLILRQLLQTMRANEAGIKADIDTEFLHDYRIAVRRTRSALSQIRNVFPPDTTAHFKTRV